jgi:aspartate aminotransferase
MITASQEVKTPNLVVSEMAEDLIGSEIIKIAAEIGDKIKNGEDIINLTIGDFDPRIFPIPTELKDEIINAYNAGQTNYPAANGILELRQAVSRFLMEREELSYSADEILISGGARPLIYATYLTLLDQGDGVIFPVPSWNNNHYVHLSKAKPIPIETNAEDNFMPNADEIRPFIKDANLLALCSPLNPTGTIFTRDGLEKICDLVLEENHRRGPEEKPLYLLYDQIYWVLTFGSNHHYNPVSIRPEMRDYTIFIDGVSKSLAATGIRVGWAFGPQRIMDKMKAILSHVGSWAPKAEQVACAKYLANKPAMDSFLNSFKESVDQRLEALYTGFMNLKKEGYKVDAISPQAAIYLTVQFDLAGKKTADGKVLENTKDVTAYLLNEAKLGIVPFYAFGASEDDTWYRISVGTCTLPAIDKVFVNLKNAFQKLS